MDSYVCVLFLLVGQMWLASVALGAKCVKTGPCSCKTDTGTIDLSPLQGSPRFKDVMDTKKEYYYSYNPCTPFDEGTACKQVSSCQVSQDKKTQYPAGTQDTASFSEGAEGNTVITYSATQGTTLRTTIVKLVCAPGGDVLTAAGETSPATYTMTLTSPHCCVNSGGGGGGGGASSAALSIGSILVIAVVVLLVVYVAVGVGVQKGVRKASGKETMPNYSFWASIPGFIKDGFVFTFSICKPGSKEYQQI